MRKGFEVTGIDLVDEFLEIARRDVPKAKFIKMDLLKLEFPKDYFDGIFACAVVVHITKINVLKALSNLYKVLKPEGVFFIYAKLGEGTTYKADKLSSYKRLMVLYGEKELREFVEKAGFKIIYFKVCPDEAGRKDIKWIRIIAKK